MHRHDIAQHIVMISCRYLCKGMSFHRHFDVATMMMIFKKKILALKEWELILREREAKIRVIELTNIEERQLKLTDTKFWISG
jgi:hypothetical protein